jgi:guanylate kinase
MSEQHADNPSGGILFIVSAPSGAGKTSLVRALLKQDPTLAVCVSHTTRPMRPTERNGINYHFVDTTTFRELIANGEFLEHADVFGNLYGTARSSVARCFDSGADVILEIDWQGAAQVRERHPDVVSVFILPPSLATLRARLHNRGEDASEVIENRLAEARTELAHHNDFDYLVVNDDFAAALNQLQAIVQAERCRRPAAGKRLQTLLEDLLSAP